ncbi:MAG TPA: SUMF1/EgtB/PvdO family nonheme iron enzyme [Polyangiaceae bacterium]|nr:SUMF1/EgtB/PvdO family nonheme iron enzyme [Polyangiaceae bacterium]
MRCREHLFRLVAFSALTGCEAFAGLQGDREEKALASAAGGSGAGGESSQSQSGGGGPVGNADDAHPAAGDDSGGSGAGLGGQSSAAGGRGGSGGGDGLKPVDAGDSGDAGTAGAVDDESGGTVLDTPSCAGLVPTGCEHVNPCLTLPVTGGSFRLGRDETGELDDYFPTGGTNERPDHAVSISPFYLDKYEVTVARFRRFVDSYQGALLDENAGAAPHIPGSGWRSTWNSKLPADAAALRARLGDNDASSLTDLRTWSTSADTGECRPLNNVDWYLAFAFCIWDGGRLPTEAEWEFVAAAGDEERLFPWGSATPEKRAVFNCAFTGGLSCTPGDLPHVGTLSPRGNGRWGHADLAGSLAEYTRDVYESGFYASSKDTTTDPVNLLIDAVANEGVVRGGEFSSSGDLLRSAARWTWLRNDRSVTVGVRCARDL